MQPEMTGEVTAGQYRFFILHHWPRPKRCQYCGVRLGLFSKKRRNPHRATVDHMVPKSLGGSNYKENLALACYACNNLKGSETGWQIICGWQPWQLEEE